MSGVRCSARLSGERAAPAARDQVRGPARGPGAPDEAARRRARAAERAREVEDSPTELKDKCRRLARALRNAKHLVVYTGAGISTAADIPDYRGPRGVWTRLRRGERVGRVEVARARPTFTHMALTALWARGALKFVVSQNCDGLHVRAGLPRRALAELHGDMFCERCAACRAVYLRAFDTTERTARHRHATRRLCHACGAELRDSIVHFGERGRAAWPLNWAGALRHAARADVVLCLGSSLKVLRRYPRLWRMHAPPAARPALYIVNLQWTPKDAAAALKINARCDAVMRQVARRLRLRVPRYSRARDPLPAHAEPLAEPERHTARRAAADFAAPPSEPSGPEDGDSPSASDSDEELPLRRLADRLRAPPPPAPADALRAFRVSLVAGEATILLRAEHAPFLAPPAEPPDPPASGTAALRRFRIARRPDHALPDARDAGSRLRRLLEAGPRLPPPGPVLEYYAKPDDESEPKPEPKPELKPEPKLEAEERPSADAEPEPKWESSESGSESEAGAGSLAAAIIRRAVLVCRASLYPGLHTIVGPPAPAECAWCARHFGVRRCRWYGPPRLTPLASRAWRRVLGRRYLCACCPGAPPAGAPPAPEDGGGWFGKGYRKGRRRRP